MVLDIEESMFETCLITHKEHQNSLELEQRELSQLSSNQAELLVYYNKEAAEVSTLVETERERERDNDGEDEPYESTVRWISFPAKRYR